MTKLTKRNKYKSNDTVEDIAKNVQALIDFGREEAKKLKEL